MQNKANLLDTQMNISFSLTKYYEQITMNNEPIKTNPIKPKQSQFQYKKSSRQAGRKSYERTDRLGIDN